MGAATGGIAGTGGGSLFKQMVTKFERNQIGNVTAATAGKMAKGAFTEYAIADSALVTAYGSTVYAAGQEKLSK